MSKASPKMQKPLRLRSALARPARTRNRGSVRTGTTSDNFFSSGRGFQNVLESRDYEVPGITGLYLAWRVLSGFELEVSKGLDRLLGFEDAFKAPGSRDLATDVQSK